MDKNIKDYRENELRSFAIGNILLILISSGLLDNISKITNETSAWLSMNTILTSAIFSSLIYIFIFLADSIIPSDIKEVMIWYIGGRPAEHIFTDIKENPKDNRFTKNQVVRQYKEVYKCIENKDRKCKEVKNIQNAIWYRIYKEHEAHIQIYTSQRDYLLCRDMFSMNLLMMIGYFCLQWYLKQCVSGKMVGVLLVELFILWIAARSKGSSFVRNVILVDISKNYQEERIEIIIPRK